ncbi:MAG TPA: hypothetical protein VFP15_03890 [Gemmatimonadaceae bacterium]|nr:hypothetical protein [Gemmatimonadaceae bacterium]
MIERLRTSLQSMHELSREALASPEFKRLRGDCADALRLELDCPQQALTRPQRERLTRLSGLLEEAEPSPADLQQAVRDAWSAIA